MGLFKPTQEEINQYLARFTGTVPLVIYGRGLFTYKFQIHFVESEIDLEYGLYSIKNIDPNKQYKIVAGFNKTKLEDFINHDWINASGKIPMLFNKRLVEKINKICPNDFIALPVTIINITDQVEPYENRDFYIVNAVNTLDVIDDRKSTFGTWTDDSKKPEKRVYLYNSWNGHLLAFEKNIKKMIWHPSLAKELYPSKQFHFLTPEEDSFYHRSGYPDGYNKETWSIWIKGVEKTMAYPRKSLYKLMGEEWKNKGKDL
jgi:hypothetical protein